MERLKEYFYVRGRQSELSRSTGLSPSYIWQIANGVKPAPAERCAAIERATKFAVMRWDLRPHDWWRVWPELIKHPEAPKIEDIEFVSGTSLFSDSHITFNSSV